MRHPSVPILHHSAPLTPPPPSQINNSKSSHGQNRTFIFPAMDYEMIPRAFYGRRMNIPRKQTRSIPFLVNTASENPPSSSAFVDNETNSPPILAPNNVANPTNGTPVRSTKYCTWWHISSLLVLYSVSPWSNTHIVTAENRSAPCHVSRPGNQTNTTNIDTCTAFVSSISRNPNTTIQLRVFLLSVGRNISQPQNHMVDDGRTVYPR
ncbi:hypothetical protein BJ875DRAFT_215949 [Amylocarpus encephaloides]|uniref:Uncharacterized protein n=1 Tax=Amylocarpus encephaloides TaxID=45428 RepID=A0A9P7YP93_9HELO|nr:hypothetical protein BJ875DRAFT_215949 [Amylocarpus encephaloides]